MAAHNVWMVTVSDDEADIFWACGSSRIAALTLLAQWGDEHLHDWLDGEEYRAVRLLSPAGLVLHLHSYYKIDIEELYVQPPIKDILEEEPSWQIPPHM